MVYVNVTIKGKIESKELWLDLTGFKDINVTDLGNETYVYCQTSMYDATTIVDICRKYGEVHAEITSI